MTLLGQRLHVRITDPMPPELVPKNIVDALHAVILDVSPDINDAAIVPGACGLVFLNRPDTHHVFTTEMDLWIVPLDAVLAIE